MASVSFAADFVAPAQSPQLEAMQLVQREFERPAEQDERHERRAHVKPLPKHREQPPLTPLPDKQPDTQKACVALGRLKQPRPQLCSDPMLS